MSIQHWQNVYETKQATDVSWFEPLPETSLRLVAKAGIGSGAAVVDIGGGASALVDHLQRQGFAVAVLDIAQAALAVSRARLGAAADDVDWIVADVLTWRPAKRFNLWHDRAVFHFLTEPEQRAAYKAALHEAVEHGGWLILATFSPNGPERCSGLPVKRWSADALAAELEDAFEAVECFEEHHLTPSGSRQAFTWALFRRR